MLTITADPERSISLTATEGRQRKLWLGQRASILLILLALLILQAPISALAQKQKQFDEFWPYKRAHQTIAERAMGPQDGSVLAVVNGRPISYNSKQYDMEWMDDYYKSSDIMIMSGVRDPATNYRLAERLLKKALEVAESRRADYPWDLVDSHVNLAVLYYQRARHREAQQHFKLAAKITEANGGLVQPGLAALYDYLGQTLRAQHKYPEAKDAYELALGIRLKLYGPSSNQAAISYMNLAMLFNDSRLPNLQQYVMTQAFDAKGDKVFINSELSSGPRPLPLFMPVKTTFAGELPNMVAFAFSIIKKQPRHQLAASGSRVEKRTLVARPKPQAQRYVQAARPQSPTL